MNSPLEQVRHIVHTLRLFALVNFPFWQAEQARSLELVPWRDICVPAGQILHGLHEVAYALENVPVGQGAHTMDLDLSENVPAVQLLQVASFVEEPFKRNSPFRHVFQEAQTCSFFLLAKNVGLHALQTLSCVPFDCETIWVPGLQSDHLVHVPFFT